MVDRLRQFLNRPLQDGERPRLFAVTVAVIVGIAAVLAVLDDAGTPGARQARPQPRPTASASEAGAAAVAPTATPVAPSEESALSVPANPMDVARSRRAARRFLRGYLAYSYGRAHAAAIAAATPQLRAELAETRPRVPAAERRDRAHVELLQTDGVGHERAELLALVRDERRRYSVRLQLANTPSGWRVTALER